MTKELKSIDMKGLQLFLKICIHAKMNVDF